MITTTKHERPGVYSSYEASSVTTARSGGKAVAIIAAQEGADGTKRYSWTSYAQAEEDCGGAMAQLARLALRNGAGLVYGIPVGTDYAAGLRTMEELEDAAVVCCDSTDIAVQQALRDSVTACAEARKERVAVVCADAGESVEQLAERAAQLNDERVALVTPGCEVAGEGTAEGGACCAAAFAGLLAGQSDPAAPLGGAVLSGLSGLDSRYTDQEVDLLVRGGVTALETIAGQVQVVRGVTTRTTTGGGPDTTWRELTTILVVDDVVPGIRQALRAKFARAKNTAQTRGAILSQVIVELENRVAREIIDGYGDVTVSALEEDPGVCLVEFSFTVAHGLNQIWLTAHITV